MSDRYGVFLDGLEGFRYLTEQYGEKNQSPPVCKWCGEIYCYCCPECGSHVAEHKDGCTSGPCKFCGEINCDRPHEFLPPTAQEIREYEESFGIFECPFCSSNCSQVLTCSNCHLIKGFECCMPNGIGFPCISCQESEEYGK